MDYISLIIGISINIDKLNTVFRQKARKACKHSLGRIHRRKEVLLGGLYYETFAKRHKELTDLSSPFGIKLYTSQN